MQPDRRREVAGPHRHVGEDEPHDRRRQRRRARRRGRAPPCSSAGGRRAPAGTSHQTARERNRAASPCISQPRKASSSAAVCTRSAGSASGSQAAQAARPICRTGGASQRIGSRPRALDAPPIAATPSPKSPSRNPSGPISVREAAPLQQPCGEARRRGSARRSSRDRAGAAPAPPRPRRAGRAGRSAAPPPARPPPRAACRRPAARASGHACAGATKASNRAVRPGSRRIGQAGRRLAVT